MKKNFYLMFVALFGVLALTSCNNDDDHPANLSDAARSAFEAQYPSARSVDWDVKGAYHVAEFHDNGVETDVWYDANGNWCMTETDLGRDLTKLPTAVQTAFQASAYSAWRVDDIDKYVRTDRTFYLIEVETSGQKDRDLYYAEDGTLLKDVEDAPNDDVTPATTF